MSLPLPSVVPSVLPSPFPSPLPSPLPTALPWASESPTFAGCAAGFGLDNTRRCASCGPGEFQESSRLGGERCSTCAPGSIPSGGACFLGTPHASTVGAGPNGTVAHAPYVASSKGSCYYFSSETATWTAAERYCTDVLDGHLVCVAGRAHADWQGVRRPSFLAGRASVSVETTRCPVGCR